MRRDQFIIWMVVGALVLSALPLSGVAAAATDEETDSSPALTTLDGDHGLHTDAARQSWADDGVATADVTAPHLTLTAAKDGSNVDANVPFGQSLTHSYLQIEYHDDLPMTLRMYVDDSYFDPYVRNGVSTVEGNHTVDVEPVDNGNMLKVTVTFDESGTATVPISSIAGTQYGLMDNFVKRLDALPMVDSSERTDETDWTTLDESELDSADAAVGITSENPDDLVIEYAEVDGDETNWRMVPENTDNSAPLYLMEQEDNPNTVYVVSEVSDPPAVRYKEGYSRGDMVSQIADEIRSITEKIQKDINNLMGARA